MPIALESKDHSSSLPATTVLHALHLYGATAIAAFGWAMCRLLGWDATPWLPLWFCGALLVYNTDRVRRDPADALNVPRRAAAMGRLRRISATVITLSAAVLVALPLVRGDWITLALVLGGALVCLNYSIPLCGFRLKDVPVVKTFIAPTIVAAAIFALPWLHEGAPASRAVLFLTALRAWGFLLFNMILCDLRDVEGDRRAGTLSLPGLLGAKGTWALLLAMLIAIEGLTIAILPRVQSSHFLQWGVLALAAPLYLGALLLAARRPRAESFYEWFVEGMLFLPAVAVVIGDW